MKLQRLMIGIIIFSLSFNTVRVSSQANVPNFKSPSIIAIDSENGQVLFEKESEIVYEVASISKLLTAYTALQAFEANPKWDENTVIPISDAAYELSQNYDISNVPLRQDENYTINELIESMAINLANGSALALAEFVAGSEAAFIELMAENLEDWGQDGYKLINVTGLPKNINPGATNSLSASTAAVIAYHLINDFPQYVEYSQKTRESFKPGTLDHIDMLNYNQMLSGKPYEYPGMLGLMPGYSEQDGASFIGLAEQNGLGVITVILGSDNEDLRYEETEALFDFIFATYRKEQVIAAEQSATQVGSIPIDGGVQTTAPLIYETDLSLVVPVIDTTPRLQYDFTLNEKIVNDSGRLLAPLEQGMKVGNMAVSGVETQVIYLPSTKGNNVSVILAEFIAEAPWYQKAWQSVTQGVNGAWESTRKFFVKLFN